MREHLTAIYALLPRGKVWPLEPGDSSSLDGLLDALAQEFDRIDADADGQLADFFPDEAVASLPDWERILGLSAGSLTDEQRQAQILSKLRRRGDPTLANVTTIAQSWGPGITVSVGNYPLFVMNIGRMGGSLRSEAWTTVIDIYYPGAYSAEFESTMIASVPLHTTIFFTHD